MCVQPLMECEAHATTPAATAAASANVSGQRLQVPRASTYVLDRVASDTATSEAIRGNVACSAVEGADLQCVPGVSAHVRTQCTHYNSATQIHSSEARTQTGSILKLESTAQVPALQHAPPPWNSTITLAKQARRSGENRRKRRGGNGCGGRRGLLLIQPRLTAANGKGKLIPMATDGVTSRLNHTPLTLRNFTPLLITDTTTRSV